MNDGSGRKPDGTFAQGNRAAYKHGGGTAVKALLHGEPLTGIAAEIKADLGAEVDTVGLKAVMRERALRYQAVADVWYGILLGATDIPTIEKATQKYGWLQAKAMAMLKDIDKMEPDTLTLEGLLQTKAVKDG